MQEFKVTVLLPDGEEQVFTVDENTTFQKIAAKVQRAYPAPVILAVSGGKLYELYKKVKEDLTISFITIVERDGKRAYRRSLVLLLQRAVMKLYGEDAVLKVLYSLEEGYYCEILCRNQRCCPCTEERDLQKMEKLQITRNELEHIRTSMDVLIEQNKPIYKHHISTRKAEKLFAQKNWRDKERLFYYRRSSRTNLYELDGCYDYFYGFMAPSTGILKVYDLQAYQKGFMLLFPDEDPKQVAEFEPSGKLFHVLQESRDWSRMLGIGTVGTLNDAIASGRSQELILLSEAMMEERIGNLAAEIAENPKRKFIMIAGPSSSGKTSFANRLSIQLMAKGKIPHPVSLDDYYVDREATPKAADGSYDFECLEALDIELFNHDMTELLAGKRVELPSYNFKTGKREYRGGSIQLGDNDILVIEGIHGLNDKLSYSLPAESKFKVYISALSQLNVDEHNPLSTTDGRLIRRMVRDARTRNISARQTIAMWPSVRRGEEKNIFPYQESADVMFNSALVYELAVLKVYAEPLLFQIPKEAPEFLEAQRLLKFLDYLLPMPAEGINKNSLLREFVGGSCFNV